MSEKEKYTYRLSRFLTGAITMEVVFWLLVWQLLHIFGAFSNTTTEEHLSFLSPQLAWLFLGVLPLFFLFYRQLSNRNKWVKKFGGVSTISSFMKPVSNRLFFARYFLVRNVVVFLIFAMMQPVFGLQTTKGQANDVELMLAIDLSNSMNTRDIEGKATRLTAAKRALKQIINQANVGQVGLLIFAGDAYPQLPLTPNKAILKMYVDELKTDFISHQGTNLAEAFIESSELYTLKKNNKVLLLVTDGEDHEGGMQKAYEKIKEKNIKVYILGIGSERGGIVLDSGKPSANSMKDDQGKAVVSRLNKTMIKEISKELKGEFIISDKQFPNVSQFLTEINKMSSTKTVHLDFEIRKNRYQIPLGLAMICFLLLTLLTMRPLKRRKR